MNEKPTDVKQYEKKYRFVERATTDNREAVFQSDVCGCLNCDNVFPAANSVFPIAGGDGCDTARCPHCGCAAVIPDAAGASIDRYTFHRLRRAFRRYSDGVAARRNAPDPLAARIFGTGVQTAAAPKTTGEELFVDAMLENRWRVALKLVGFGVRPGEVRHADGADRLSALGLALEAGEYEVAEKLYEAGDRLDDYCHHVGADMRLSLLSMLSAWNRAGRDFFLDEHASLSECCRKGLLLQALPLLDAGVVSRKELDRAAAAMLEGLPTAAFAFGYPEAVAFLRRIFELGGRWNTGDRDELREALEQLEKAPRAARWRIDPASAAELRALAEKYTRAENRAVT